MKRILLVMAVGLVMAAVVVAMSMPAFAANNHKPPKFHPNDDQGPTCATPGPNSNPNCVPG